MHTKDGIEFLQMENQTAVLGDGKRSSAEENMKSRLLRLAIVVFIVTTPSVFASARTIDVKSYEELYSKADVVMVVHALSTRMSKSDDGIVPLPNKNDDLEPIFTRFRKLAVLKGQLEAKEFELCHHRYKATDDARTIANGPMLVNFPTYAYNKGDEWKEWMGPGNNDFIVFLVRDSDGRLDFVTGQYDPALSVRRLTAPQQRSDEP